MDLYSIDAILRDHYSVERFWGQTVLYLPMSISKLTEEQRVSVVCIFFPKHKLAELHWTVVENFRDLPPFYELELPNVLVVGKKVLFMRPLTKLANH